MATQTAPRIRLSLCSRVLLRAQRFAVTFPLHLRMEGGVEEERKRKSHVGGAATSRFV